MQLFQHIFWIWLSWFLRLDSNRISQVHDMTIKFFSIFFRCFFYDLFVLSNDTCHRWLSRLKHHFARGNCLEQGRLLGPKSCLHHFCQQERVMAQKGFHFCQQKGVTAQKCPRDIGNFSLVDVPCGNQSRTISRRQGLEICVFVIEKGLTGSKL